MVVTSSISAIIPSPGWPAEVVKDESCWTDLDYCRQNEVSTPSLLVCLGFKMGLKLMDYRFQIWYPASKTMAEKQAWDFAKEYGLDLVVVNPGTVMGPIIPPSINASMLMLLRLLQGMQNVISRGEKLWAHNFPLRIIMLLENRVNLLRARIFLCSNN